MKRFDKLVQNRKLIYALAALVAGILCAVVIGFIFFANIDSISGFFEGVTSHHRSGLAYIIDPVAKFFETKVFVKIKKRICAVPSRR